MSVTTRSPLRMAPAVQVSGWPATNEFAWTRGGMQSATFYSGNIVSGGQLVSYVAFGSVAAGSDLLVFSGAGRLNTIYPLYAQSGTISILYDSHAVASGGPFATSGHRYLGAVPANTHDGLANAGPKPIQVDVPFFSGLCINFRSGVAPFMITYTPEGPGVTLP